MIPLFKFAGFSVKGSRSIFLCAHPTHVVKISLARLKIKIRGTWQQNGELDFRAWSGLPIQGLWTSRSKFWSSALKEVSFDPLTTNVHWLHSRSLLAFQSKFTKKTFCVCFCSNVWGALSARRNLCSPRDVCLYTRLLRRPLWARIRLVLIHLLRSGALWPFLVLP